MSVQQQLSSPARWAVLNVLTEATEPLDRRQIATRANVRVGQVIEVMRRPATAGWVTQTKVPSGHHTVSIKFVYAITDLGRKVLADHLKGTDE